jgi:predicted amino acid-binding ACT domain protein
MICIVALPATVTAAEVRRRLRAIQPGAPWEVGIRPYRPPRKRRPGGAPGSRYVITASGPDKTGLVATLSGFLREKGINIEDLATLVRDEVYWMVLTVRLPAGSDVGALKRELHAMMAGVGVRCELMHQSIFDATNEV